MHTSCWLLWLDLRIFQVSKISLIRKVNLTIYSSVSLKLIVQPYIRYTGTFRTFVFLIKCQRTFSKRVTYRFIICRRSIRCSTFNRNSYRRIFIHPSHSTLASQSLDSSKYTKRRKRAGTNQATAFNSTIIVGFYSRACCKLSFREYY